MLESWDEPLNVLIYSDLSNKLVIAAHFFSTTFHGFVALFPTIFRCFDAFFEMNHPICYVFTGDENIAK
jgi:hypothetical protein